MKIETIQTIARHAGPRGEVVLRRRLGEGPSTEELIINGVFAMDSSETSTERLLGELAVPSGRAERVLVGGLGLGYTVAEISAKDVGADRRHGDRAMFDRLGTSGNHCDAGGSRFRFADSVPRRGRQTLPSRDRVTGWPGSGTRSCWTSTTVRTS